MKKAVGFKHLLVVLFLENCSAICEWSNWRMEMVCDGVVKGNFKTKQPDEAKYPSNKNKNNPHAMLYGKDSSSSSSSLPVLVSEKEKAIQENNGIKTSLTVEDILSPPREHAMEHHIKHQSNHHPREDHNRTSTSLMLKLLGSEEGETGHLKVASKELLKSKSNTSPLPVVGVMFSAAVYSSADNTLALVENIFLFNKGQSFKTIIHVSFPGTKIVSIAPSLASYNAYFNPTRNVVTKGGLKIMRAHFSNFIFAQSNIADFKCFFFLAENSFFVLPGLIPKILAYDSLYFKNAKYPTRCENPPKPEDKLLVALAAEYGIPNICTAKHTIEGTFYSQSVLTSFVHRFMKINIDAAEGETSIIGPKYPHEELYLPTIVASRVPEEKALKNTKLIKTYWTPNGLPHDVSMTEMLACQQEHCAYLIKRIHRGLNNPVKACLKSPVCAVKGLSSGDRAIMGM